MPQATNTHLWFWHSECKYPLVSIHESFINQWALAKFPIQKWTIFRKVKKIKGLRLRLENSRVEAYKWYVAQAIPQIDAEIAEKGHLWMETN